MVLGACRNTVDTDVGLSQPPDRQVLGEWIGGSEVTRVGHVVRLKQRRCDLEMTKNLLELNATPPELNQPMPLRSNDSRISAAVGFIALSGIAVLNGLVMVAFFRDLIAHGKSVRDSIVEGALSRLHPVLMTALSAGLALVPLVLASDAPGKEILHPVAVVIVGGLMTSTVLGLGVTPAIFWALGKKAALKAVERNSPATQ